jgi:hypothetical protein
MAIDPKIDPRRTPPTTDPDDMPRRSRVDGTLVDDRAQPGDVLGIERDGETTELGDTREDEDERREDAEKAAQKR